MEKERRPTGKQYLAQSLAQSTAALADLLDEINELRARVAELESQLAPKEG